MLLHIDIGRWSIHLERHRPNRHDPPPYDDHEYVPTPMSVEAPFVGFLPDNRLEQDRP